MQFADVQRFREGGVLERQPVRDAAHPHRVDEDLITEPAVVRVRVPDDLRDARGGVGDDPESRHSITDRETGDARADFRDDAGVLVAEHHRTIVVERGERVTCGVDDVDEAARVLRHAQVAAADAAGHDVDPQLPGPGSGKVGNVGERELAPMELDGAHVQAPVCAGAP